ncbi:MAG: transcriptional regulator [Gammaproteobacteria bacterium]|nr:transcriptional regulator [Gammaproteobacteria bacterium]
MIEYTGCGLPNIYLSNGYAEVNTPFGKSVSIDDMEGLHRAIGMEIVNREPTLSGQEFRFLRKELLLSQDKLGGLLGRDSQTIALWEKEKGDLPKMADMLLRAIYTEHLNENVQIMNMIERLNELDRIERDERRFEFAETDEGWRAA